VTIIQGYLKIRTAAILTFLMIGKLRVQIWRIVKWHVVHSKCHKIRINCTAVREEYIRTWYCKKNLIMRFQIFTAVRSGKRRRVVWYEGNNVFGKFVASIFRAVDWFFSSWKGRVEGSPLPNCTASHTERQQSAFFLHADNSFYLNLVWRYKMDWTG
jgi:hypothetical protein